MLIAYSGIEGSFAGIATEKIFPNQELLSCYTFREAYDQVEKGNCEACVLPIENSYAGEIGQVSDLMFAGTLEITGVYELHISQCLLGVKGSTAATIRKVISHPQALEQCGDYIARSGYETVPYENTARAAKKVAQQGDPNLGAIGSYRAAELYGLEILDENINESTQNVTRFAVFQRAHATGAVQPGSNTILMFTIRHCAGALARAITIVGKHNYNMRVIRSRPVKDVNWQYYFYTEIEGRLDTEEGWRMLEQLKTVCEVIKVIGTYTPGMCIDEKEEEA